MLNNLLSVIHYEPSLSISKMSRDERIKRNIKNIERQNQIRTSKELKASQFTNKNIKAIGGVFQEIEIGGKLI